MQTLWMRIVFSILISNTDDHLRNHGFLYEGPTGWRLSPAYDLNPVPADIKPRILSTAIDLHDASASLELALSVSQYFELSHESAFLIASRIGQAVSRWRAVASGFGLKEKEIDRMASAFEHVDSIQAIPSKKTPRKR
jgi:serine/threonine-protein kinase HipA